MWKVSRQMNRRTHEETDGRRSAGYQKISFELSLKKGESAIQWAFLGVICPKRRTYYKSQLSGEKIDCIHVAIFGDGKGAS